MMSIRIERIPGDATLSDAFAVRRAVFIDEQGVSEAVEMDGKDDDATHVVAYDDASETADTTPVGTARLRTTDEDGAKIERVAVLADYRGRGVGTELMAELEAIAAERGLSTVELHAQTRVEAFYERLGYERTSGVFQEAGIDHVAMEKSLDTGPNEE
jgi:predicted GNAT family N-acyltransferase